MEFGQKKYKNQTKRCSTKMSKGILQYKKLNLLKSINENKTNNIKT